MPREELWELHSLLWTKKKGGKEIKVTISYTLFSAQKTPEGEGGGGGCGGRGKKKKAAGVYIIEIEREKF